MTAAAENAMDDEDRGLGGIWAGGEVGSTTETEIAALGGPPDTMNC